MSKTLLSALIVGACLSTGCIKTSNETAVKADGTASVKMSVRYKTDTYASMKKAPLDCTCWRIYQVHKDSIPAAMRALADFESSFDAAKVSEKWSKLGLDVSKAAVTESDGWRVLEMEATVPSVAEYHAKLAEASKAWKDEYLTAIPWYLHSRKLMPRLPRFYRTSEPDVVKAVIPVADVGPELKDIAELEEAEHKKLRTQLGYLRTLKAFDEGAIRVRVELPGTIQSVENASQDGSAVVFEIKGPDVTPEGISAQAAARGQIVAKLKIDPATFKIPLETEPE
jgi:hypothetical protein